MQFVIKYRNYTVSDQQFVSRQFSIHKQAKINRKISANEQNLQAPTKINNYQLSIWQSKVIIQSINNDSQSVININQRTINQ